MSLNFATLLGLLLIPACCVVGVNGLRSRIAATWVLLCVLARSAIAVYDVFTGPQGDANDFFNLALAQAQLHANSFQIGYVYSIVLGEVFSIAGSSHLLGNMLSVFAFVISCKLLAREYFRLHRSKGYAFGMLAFAGLPAAMIFESWMLREAYQLLFFTAMLCSILALRRRISISRLLALMVSAALLAVLHRGLLGFVVIGTAAGLAWAARLDPRGLRPGRIFAAGAATVAALVIWWSVLPLLGGQASVYTSDSAIETISSYREAGGDPAVVNSRSSYGVSLDLGSIPAALISIPAVFAAYLLFPMPWQVTSVIDVYAMADNLFRLALMTAGIVQWRRSRAELRSVLGILLFLAFVMELIWALGTGNWGTALRHHLIAYPAFILAGSPILSGLVTRIKITATPNTMPAQAQ